MPGKITMKKKLFITMTAALLIAAMVGVTAFAADPEVTLTGGTLSGGDITFDNFAGVTLNGAQQDTDATWSVGNVVDARGTGAGWNLSLTLSQLTETTNGKLIPLNSITVKTAPTVTPLEDSSPANTITVVGTSAVLDKELPVKLLSAAIDGGMGSFSISSVVATLTVPANAYAGTYKTTALVEVNNVP